MIRLATLNIRTEADTKKQMDEAAMVVINRSIVKMKNLDAFGWSPKIAQQTTEWAHQWACAPGDGQGAMKHALKKASNKMRFLSLKRTYHPVTNTAEEYNWESSHWQDVARKLCAKVRESSVKPRRGLVNK